MNARIDFIVHTAAVAVLIAAVLVTAGWGYAVAGVGIGLILRCGENPG